MPLLEAPQGAPLLLLPEGQRLPAGVAPIRVATKLVTTTADLAELADEWNELADNIPFRRHEWLATWWRHFSTPRTELRVVTLRDRQGKLVGAMPWFLCSSAWHGRVLRTLGSGMVCTDYVSLLAAQEQKAALAGQLAGWLDNELADEWDAIELDQVDPTDPALATLVESLRQRDYTIHESVGMNCWRIPLPGTWDEYLARFSKRRRERVRSAYKKGFDSGRGMLHRAQTSAELSRGWEILVDLHQRRRRSLGQPGCFATPRFATFLRDAVIRLFDRGLVRLSWLEWEGRPAAVELNLVGGTTVYGYQMGMEPELAGSEPGNLRIAGSLRSAIEEGFTGYDLLRGDEPYKAKWQAQPRPLVRWRIVNRRLSSRCRHRVWLGTEAAKQAARRVRDRNTAEPAPSAATAKSLTGATRQESGG